jgi:RNA polymerase sigma-70 factor (ECF subfamily)
MNEAKNVLKSSWNTKVNVIEEDSYPYQDEVNEEKRFFEMIYNLPDKYKTVIILFYYENLDIKEISKVLHLSEAAVKKRLERARNILKEEESKNEIR